MGRSVADRGGSRYGRIHSGEGREILAVPLPAGANRAVRTKRLAVRIDEVTFQVRDVTIELTCAPP
jgi:hypothetical protein